MAVPLDTSTAAAQLHVEAYRELGIAGRLRIALELSDLTHADGDRWDSTTASGV